MMDEVSVGLTAIALVLLLVRFHCDIIITLKNPNVRSAENRRLATEV